MRLASIFVIASFLVIPVRCDAAAAPHSIFVAADAMAMPATHTHRATVDPQPASEKSVPHHSPVDADSAADHHHSHASAIPNDPAQQLCSLYLANGSDPESQQPIGVTIDAPATSVTPNAITFQPLETQPTVLIFAPAALLSGVTTPPDAPPPKLA